ncbi:hypothetical protein Lalb_Chr16g0378231 [Lupinus albus]|uniref:Uncharacterized protein n=1 Tax=Lupinus albus TaxID=3870 RepID=A0A6A4P575_LUPAL|nr:hypothetical protein Lalb_Chr16g0378231 [Lupinus albus]
MRRVPLYAIAHQHTESLHLLVLLHAVTVTHHHHSSSVPFAPLGSLLFFSPFNLSLFFFFLFCFSFTYSNVSLNKTKESDMVLISTTTPYFTTSLKK